MSLMPLNNPNRQRRRDPFSHAGSPGVGLPGGLGGGLGGFGGIGGLGAMGMTPYGAAGTGNMALYRGGRGFTPFEAMSGAGAMRGGANPFTANRNYLGNGYPDHLLRKARWPADTSQARLQDILIAQQLNQHSYPDINALLNLGLGSRGRDPCDGVRCRGGMGCGYDPKSEYERCTYDCSRCSGESSSSSTKDLNTKDIVVRGKTYKVRKAFLADSSKFENDIVKLLDKKSEEAVPNNVVQMLVDFINTEDCNKKSLLDLVSLNILASNLGVKSAVEYSLKQLKKYQFDHGMRALELTHICLAVMESSKVDDKLVEWLKKYLKTDGMDGHLFKSFEFQVLSQRKPELYVHLQQLLGYAEKDEQEGDYRVI